MTRVYKDMEADSFEFGGKEYKIEGAEKKETSFSFDSIKRGVVSGVSGERLSVALNELLDTLGDRAEGVNPEDLQKNREASAPGSASGTGAIGRTAGSLEQSFHCRWK